MTRTWLLGLSLLATAAVTGCNFGDSSNNGGDAGFGESSASGIATLVAPPGEDFGTVAVGAQSAPADVSVSNPGTTATGPLSIALGGPDASSFGIDVDTCSGQSVAGGAQCDVKVHFAPKSAGARAATLTITGQPGGTIVVALAGNGAAAGPLAVSPAQQDFSIVATGVTSGAVPFVFANPGKSASGPLAVSLTGTDAAQFKLIDPCSGKPLAAGGQCSVTVAFAPGSTGAKAATLSGMAPGAGAASAALTGTGAKPAAFAVTPATYDFGSILESSPTAPQTFTVKNTGGVPTGTPTVFANGTNAADFTVTSNQCGTALSAGSSCTFALVFKPSTAAAEAATVTVSATATASGTAALQGTGLAPAAIALSPTSQPFGSWITGQTSPDTTFTVTNNGGVVTGALAVTLGGTSAGQFGTTADTCTGATLAASGGTCTVNVHFAPTTGTVGAVQATLTATGTPGGTTAAQLSGTAIAPASLTITPTSKDFGTWAWGTSSPDTTFTVKNTGGVATGTLASTIPLGSQFLPGNTDSCTNTTLAPNATCLVSARFAPPLNAPTPASTSLTVSDGAATVSAPLSGASVQPAVLAISPPVGFNGFGTVIIPNTASAVFTVSNGGGQASGPITMTLAATGSAEYALTADTCTGATLAPAASCTVGVVFTASASGPANTQLQVAASPGGPATYSISGTAATQATLAITPPTGFTDFGTLVSGTTGPDFAFTVSNTGGVDSGPLSVSLGAASPAGDYGITLPNGCQNVVLGPGLSCTVNVHFSPPAGMSGTETASLDVSGSPGGTPSFALSGTADTAAQLVVTPQGAFGSVLMGHTVTVSFTLSNSGQQASSTPALSTGDADFVVNAGTCTGPVVNGSPCTFSVAFTPSAPARAESATLTAATTIGNGTTAPLNATGVTLVIDLTSWTGNTDPGGSASQTFTVKNPSPQTTFGKVLSSVSGARYSLQGGSCTFGQNLAGLATCTAIVTYTAGPVPGEEDKGTLTVTDTTVDQVQASLDWFYGLVFSPNPGVFPSTTAGTSSGPMTFTVTNHGTKATGAPSFFAFSGKDSNAFIVLAGQTCNGQSLAAFGQAGDTCTVQAQFSPPATGGPGNKTATLSATPACTFACGAVAVDNVSGQAL
ncbi:MAG TPA: choice-of-anchor D domain-containing protein [Polyangiaceae bacterium]